MLVGHQKLRICNVSVPYPHPALKWYDMPSLTLPPGMSIQASRVPPSSQIPLRAFPLNKMPFDATSVRQLSEHKSDTSAGRVLHEEHWWPYWHANSGSPVTVSNAYGYELVPPSEQKVCM